MENSTLIKKVNIVNEGQIKIADIFIRNGIIEYIGSSPSFEITKLARVIDGTDKHLFPGVIDGQVHFREPGLTHKGDIYSESGAAVAGGTTSFIDMPNTVPNVLTTEILDEKFRIAAEKSWANYSFFLGVNKDNLETVLEMDTTQFIGVSDDGLYFTKRGNLLADSPDTMDKLFSKCKSIIAIHSELEEIIEENEKIFRANYRDDVPIEKHPLIRSGEGCYQSTKRAIAIAEKYKARLHILHLTTEAETHLFRNDIPLSEKNITTEVSVQNLWFSDKDYTRLGTFIKWNPAIKTEKDREGLLKALLDDRIDIITTDHAPHTIEEKQKPYFQSMSGAPMVQHALYIMLELYKRGLISLEKIAEKMSHNVAVLYGIEKRGFIREGYFADLTLVDLNSPWTVSKENVLYKCGWSPLEGETFHSKVIHTFVNGNVVYENGSLSRFCAGRRLEFKQKSGAK